MSYYFYLDVCQKRAKLRRIFIAHGVLLLFSRKVGWRKINGPTTFLDISHQLEVMELLQRMN